MEKTVKKHMTILSACSGSPQDAGGRRLCSDPMIPTETYPTLSTLLKMLQICELLAMQHLSENLHALGFQSIFSFTAQISQHYPNFTAQSISTCCSCDSNLAYSPTGTGHWVCHTQESVTDPAVACCLYKMLLIPQSECCFHDRPHSFPPHCFPLHMAELDFQLWLNTDVPSISHLFLFLTSEAIANLLFS